jgi:hypothetical protein
MLDGWSGVLLGCRSRVEFVLSKAGERLRAKVYSTWAHDGRNKVRSLPRRRIFYFIACVHLSIPSSGMSLSLSLVGAYFLTCRTAFLLCCVKAPFRLFRYFLPGLYCAYIATLPLAPRLSGQSPDPPSSSSSEKKDKDKSTSTTTTSGSSTPEASKPLPSRHAIL